MIHTIDRQKLRFAILNLVIVILIICYMETYNPDIFKVFRLDLKSSEKESQRTLTVINYNQSEVQKSTKLILLWRPLYKTVRTFIGDFEKYCPLLPCTVSSDKALLSKADAVFVEVEALETLPKRGKIGQVWIYVDMEPPTNSRNGLLNWNNFFNWTFSYRRDSDFVTNYAYVPNFKTESANIEERIANKTEHMAWIVSHCRTAGKREKYAEALQKHFHVDIFGKCGKEICDKDKGCEYKYVKDYKFYLAAENSNCRDYITEKTVRPLQVSTLPIVKGGSNYTLYLPSNSYIDVSDFSSPRSLAKYLKIINNVDELYKYYFAWQNLSCKSEVPGYNAYCEICRKLHSPEKYRRLYRSIHDWWRGNEENAGEYFCNKEELIKL